MTFRVTSNGTEMGTKVQFLNGTTVVELTGIVGLKFEVGKAGDVRTRLTIEVVGAELDIETLPADTVVIPLEGAQDVPEPFDDEEATALKFQDVPF